MTNADDARRLLDLLRRAIVAERLILTAGACGSNAALRLRLCRFARNRAIADLRKHGLAPQARLLLEAAGAITVADSATRDELQRLSALDQARESAARYVESCRAALHALDHAPEDRREAARWRLEAAEAALMQIEQRRV